MEEKGAGDFGLPAFGRGSPARFPHNVCIHSGGWGRFASVKHLRQEDLNKHELSKKGH